MKREVLKLGIVVLIGIVLECVVFNFEYMMTKLDTSKDYNIIYTQEELRKINWIEENGVLVSEFAPQLIIESLDMYVDQVSISYTSNQVVSNILLFYSSEDIPDINGDLFVQCMDEGLEKRIVEIGSYVKDLRIDLGDESNISFQNIEIVINPVEFHFSMSRIIAIVLIYLTAKGLFKLQDSPDYGLN